jgi:hypothetical protein
MVDCGTLSQNGYGAIHPATTVETSVRTPSKFLRLWHVRFMFTLSLPWDTCVTALRFMFTLSLPWDTCVIVIAFWEASGEASGKASGEASGKLLGSSWGSFWESFWGSFWEASGEASGETSGEADLRFNQVDIYRKQPTSSCVLKRIIRGLRKN